MMSKKFCIKIEYLVILLSLVIGINSQFLALSNKYVINDDVRVTIYWMQQFQDNGLFKNDLLTEFAKNYSPWGFTFLFYIFSFIINPIIFGKIISIVLLSFSSLYIFKLLKLITKNNYTGFLGALIFAISPAFIVLLVGGNPRSFAFPLLIVFLYYLIKKQYLISNIIMILQCLFYPFIFLLSALTYLLTFIKIRYNTISFDRSKLKRIYFIIFITLCFFILFAKYRITYNPVIGTLVTLAQMNNQPEYYKEGRWEFLPTPPLLARIKYHLKESIFEDEIVKKYQEILCMTKVRISVLNSTAFVVMLFLALFLIFEIIRKNLLFPPEILYLFLSSVVIYIISAFVMPILWPDRYVFYSIRIIGLIIFTLAVGQLIIKIKDVKVRKIFQLALIVLIFSNFNINKNINLRDFSHSKELCQYLNTLPQDTIIASHPKLADNIPIFSRRIVFISNELSVPMFDNYWKEIKKRTYEFFNAYYSEYPLSVYRFCEKNKIDYLVVDKRHFTKKYLRRKKMYFEPFNTYIINIIAKRKNFALNNISERDKLFMKDDIFVIKKDVLKHL